MTSRAPQHEHTASSHDRHITTNGTVESPSHEVDVLNDLIGGSYASDGHQSGRRLPWSPPASYSPAWSLADDRMSANPAREVTESLKSFEFTSSAQSSITSSPRRSDELSEQEWEQEGSEGRLLDRNTLKMDSSLPANDGMHALRQKLQEIRKLAISTEEKAKRMHFLMTEDYMARRAISSSPASLNEGDSISISDEPAALDVGLAAIPIDPSNPYNIRSGDLLPSLSPLPSISHHDLDESMEEEDLPVLGCMHYKRNVKLQCFDCHRWFPCRYCHDQSQDLPFPHYLRRKMTRNMLCMLCQTPQPAAETCVSCGEYAAYYFCPKCKLWDNDSNKRIYHCDDCGICRLGEGLGKDFVHCKKCNVCISIATYPAHACIERATEGPCPLCLDEMFASRAKVVSLPCGHYMHGECYRDLMAVTYKCPVCSKSAVNMELQWRKLDDEIRAQPMPDDDEIDGLLPHVQDDGEGNRDISSLPPPRRPRTVWIGCNDCGSRCWTTFHWLGLKCHNCDSYNTNQMAPTAGHETEAERLIRQQQIHSHHDITGNAVLRDAGIGAEEQLRVDSALDVPSSPAQLAVPASPGSPGSTSSGAQSPRRYFVQDDEPRRPSFTTPRFSTPSLPALPNLPEMPRLPRMPNMPNLPNMPDWPNLPNIPDWPNMPNLPNMSNLELPRFSPYDMFDSLSRSLSPMRYYLQGLDVRDEEIRRDANRSPTSVHSDPTANATASKLKGSEGLADDDAVEFWGSDGHFLSSEGDDEGSAPDAQAVDDDDEEESETDSDDVSDAEMVEDDLDGGDDDEDMELFGHR